MPEVTCPAIVFSVSYIGDLVTATLTLDIIARSQAVTVVAAPGAAPLLAGDPRVAAVRLVRSARAVGWRFETLRELWRARRLGAPILNLEVYPPRWRFIRALAGALALDCRQLDLPALWADNAASARRQTTREPHRSRYYALAASAPSGAAATPRLTLGADEIASARARIDPSGAVASPLVVVHPGSSDAQRRPGLEQLVGVLNRILSAGPARIAIVGIPAEAPLTARLCASLPASARGQDLCGRLDLRSLAALLCGADLFVGGDSGPLKIAEAVGCRTLSFWAPGAPSPAFAGPLGTGHVTLEKSCAPEHAAAAALALLAEPR